jgi:hypothetical protein
MDTNPFKICTLNHNSNCKGCNINGKLDCKLDKKQQKKSMISVFNFVIIAIIGLIFTGFITGIWGLLLVFIIFIGLFFFVIEPKINCSHCPYYAENTRFMNCPGNNFFPKLWKYNPKPIKSIEKTGSIFGFAFMGLFPLISEIYGLWFVYSNNLSFTQNINLGLIIFLILTIISYFIFISFFLISFCPRCINFSCKLNRVPKELVDEYLKKNPVIKDAWSEL